MKCAVVLFALLGTAACGIPGIPINPADLIRVAGLFGCRLNGKDGQIDREFARVILGFGNPANVQKCMIGCMIGWMNTANNFVMFETGIDMVPNIGLPWKKLGEWQGNLRGCIKSALVAGRKCTIVPDLMKCMARAEEDNARLKYQSFLQGMFPWMPCWDYLKTNVPIFKLINNVANKLKDGFIQKVEEALGFIRPKVGVTNLPLVIDNTTQPVFGPQLPTQSPVQAPQEEGTQLPSASPPNDALKPPATSDASTT